MVIDFRQRKVKIKPVWKILNQGKIWTTTYTHTNSFNQQVISRIATIDISDHLPIFCVTATSIKIQKQTMSFRDYISFNEELCKNDISA